MLSLKTNGLDKHAKGMSLHLGYFDTASLLFWRVRPFRFPAFPVGKAERGISNIIKMVIGSKIRKILGKLAQCEPIFADLSRVLSRFCFWHICLDDILA